MRYIPRSKPLTGILLATGALVVTMAGPVIVSATAQTQQASPSCDPGGACIFKYELTTTTAAQETTTTSASVTTTTSATSTTSVSATSSSTAPITSTGTIGCGPPDTTLAMEVGEDEICQPPAGYTAYYSAPDEDVSKIFADTDPDWVSLGTYVLKVNLLGVANACIYVPQQRDVVSPDTTDSTAETAAPIDAIAFGATRASVASPVIVGIGDCP
jgi:hypothetical protein